MMMFFRFLSSFLCVARVCCLLHRTVRNIVQRETRRKKKNCLFKLLRRWLRDAEIHKRTRKTLRSSSSWARQNCYIAMNTRHATETNSARRSDARGLCHVTRRVGKLLLCFHFEFSNATDNHTEKDIRRKSHTLDDDKQKTKNTKEKINEIKKRLLNFFSGLWILFFCFSCCKKKAHKGIKV